MPSFFSAIGRTFGRKKGEDSKDKHANQNLTAPKSKRASLTSSLLDGHKFGNQATSATPSSPAERSVAQQPPKSVRNVAPPTLTLTLPDIGTSESADPGLDAVFESGPANIPLLSESEIGGLQLSLSDALLLEEACSKIIIERGLEALGIMHPNWYSTSPAAQRKIISYFMHGITSPRPSGTITTTTELSLAPFQSEIQYSRTPHDVASVLRWGLRHLTLSGKPFGNSADEWGWYQSFSKSERTSSFPKRAYSDILTSLIPSNHAHLLKCFLDLATSLAAHSEANGISGSKLSKTLGWWLLSNRSQGSNWATFYDEWETAGRVLEHILLAHIRDQTAQGKMPKRLTELVQAYPYGKESDGIFLPKPRFTTRTHDALLARIDIERLPGFEPSKRSILQLVEDALKANNLLASDEFAALWESLQKETSSVEEPSGDKENETGKVPEAKTDISKIFADDTITLLNSTASAGSDGPRSPTLTMFTAPPTSRLTPVRRRSLSVGDAQPSSPTSANGLSRVSSNQPKASEETQRSPPPAAASNIGSDWGKFSNSGFFFDDKIGASLASTLINAEPESPRPRPSGRKSSSKRGQETPRNRSVSTGPPSVAKISPRSTEVLRVKSCSVVSVDEAFIDFWSDAVLDPITANWPQFVLCQLKPSAALHYQEKTLGWVVIEAVQSIRPPTPKAEPETPVPSTPQTVDRRLSASSRKSPSVASTTKRRFPFFGSPSLTSKTMGASKKDAGKSPRIGEMGEMLSEEDGKMSPPAVASTTHESSSSAVAVATATATAAIGLGVTAAAVVNGHSEDKEQKSEAPIPTAEDVPAPEPVENLVAEPSAPEKVDETAAAAIEADVPAPVASSTESDVVATEVPVTVPDARPEMIHEAPTAEYLPPIEDVVVASPKLSSEEAVAPSASPALVVDSPPVPVDDTPAAVNVPEVPEAEDADLHQDGPEPAEDTTLAASRTVVAPAEIAEVDAPIVQLVQSVEEPKVALPLAPEVSPENVISELEVADVGVKSEPVTTTDTVAEPTPAASTETEAAHSEVEIADAQMESTPVSVEAPTEAEVPETISAVEVTTAEAAPVEEMESAPALDNSATDVVVVDIPTSAEATAPESSMIERESAAASEIAPSTSEVSSSIVDPEPKPNAIPSAEEKESAPVLENVPAGVAVLEEPTLPEAPVIASSPPEPESAPVLENVPAGADVPVVATVVDSVEPRETAFDAGSAPVLENVPAGAEVPVIAEVADHMDAAELKVETETAPVLENVPAGVELPSQPAVVESTTAQNVVVDQDSESAPENVPAASDLPVVEVPTSPEGPESHPSAPVLENVPAGTELPDASTVAEASTLPPSERDLVSDETPAVSQELAEPAVSEVAPVSHSPNADEVAASYTALVEPVSEASQNAAPLQEDYSPVPDAVSAPLDDVPSASDPTEAVVVATGGPTADELTPNPAVAETESAAEPAQTATQPEAAVDELAVPTPLQDDSRATSAETEANPEIVSEATETRSEPEKEKEQIVEDLSQVAHSNGNGAIEEEGPQPPAEEST